MGYVEDDKNFMFLELLTQHQRKLYGYIYSFVPNAADSDDLLQETNLVLWRKSHQYKMGTNFTAWACQIAYLNIKNFFKTKGRNRVCFDEELLSELTDLQIARIDTHTVHATLLINCLGKLSAKSREIVRLRYDGNHRIKDIADQLGRPIGSIHNALINIRLKLWKCVQYALKEEAI